MPNYSYFSRLFTTEYSAFIDEVTSDLRLPDAKLLNSLTFGMLKNATSIVSHSARSSKSDGETIHVAEHRLTDRLSTCDFSKVTARLESIAARFRYGDGVIVFDESDIQKPYGKSFEALDLVQDGSREGRPVGKGYHVVGIGVIGARKTPFPLRLYLYSTKSKGFKSSFDETKGSVPKGTAKSVSADRGFDSARWFGHFESLSIEWVVRAKSQRKYSTRWGKLTSAQTQRRVKGRFSFRFRDPWKKDDAYVKATAVKVSHQDFGEAWLICEYFPNEAEARCYLTSIDCSTREGCEKALKCYRLRWRIEELFRFVKWAFKIEGIRVRTIKGQNALLTAAMVATFFLCLLIESESPLYRACKNAWPSFRPEASDEEIEEKYGHLPIGLYHVMGGASVIAGHLRGEPKLLRKGRSKKKHGHEQLRLF
ncbi:MAG: transposase [Bacilli bacterium]|nr:transposase [Bacilli bacterium]